MATEYYYFNSYKKLKPTPTLVTTNSLSQLSLPSKSLKMEDHYSPYSCTYYYQDEGFEDLRQYLLCTNELEVTILSAKEEITRRELEIIHLKDLLSITIKERNEAQLQCQKLMQEKCFLQQQLLVQKQQEHCQDQQQQEVLLVKQEAPPVSGTYSSEDESPKSCENTNHINSADSENIIFASNITDPICLQQEVPDLIEKLAADKPLPEKGKLLQAVKEAGPLLQTLLLAGPLPQWQHPPPQLDSIDIPPVTISSPTVSLIHQDSFSLSKKRGLASCEGLDSSSSPNKYQKVVFH